MWRIQMFKGNIRVRFKLNSKHFWKSKKKNFSTGLHWDMFHQTWLRPFCKFVKNVWKNVRGYEWILVWKKFLINLFFEELQFYTLNT